MSNKKYRCTDCGKPLSENAEYCEFCGQANISSEGKILGKISKLAILLSLAVILLALGLAFILIANQTSEEQTSKRDEKNVIVIEESTHWTVSYGAKITLE